jgi:hypothetical protein
MTIDVEGKSCPICALATVRGEVESRGLAMVHGRSARHVRATRHSPAGDDVRLAHELLAFAIDEGVPEHRWRAMVAAHLRHGGSLATLDDLLPLAWNLGLDVGRTSAALGSGRYRTRLAGGCPLLVAPSHRESRPQPVLRRCASS